MKPTRVLHRPHHSMVQKRSRPCDGPGDVIFGTSLQLPPPFGDDLHPDGGPRSRTEMWHWPAVGVARCYEAGLSQYMTEKFQAGLEVTTDYSGLGTGEVALSHIRTAADRFGLTVMDTQLGSGSLSFCSATECSDACREILLAHEGHPSLPDCVLSQQSAIYYTNSCCHTSCVCASVSGLVITVENH